MLQIYKNNVVTQVTQDAADVRQRELNFYTNNYWTWGCTSTVMAGFVFSQLANPVPKDTDFALEITYLVFTAVCLGLNLCIITWTVLCCMWAPGLALRGPEGMKSFHDTITFLKDEQQSIYMTFVFSVLTYFGSSCCLVWVYPSQTAINRSCMGVLLVFLVILVLLQIRLEMRLGGSIFSHEGPDGRINTIEAFGNVADLDDYVGTTMGDHTQVTVEMPGLFESGRSGSMIGSKDVHDRIRHSGTFC